jgi:cytochrome c556
VEAERSRSGSRNRYVGVTGAVAQFRDFYQRAQTASKLALDATRAKHGNEFKALIGQLRAACNGCHAAYLRTE